MAALADRIPPYRTALMTGVNPTRISIGQTMAVYQSVIDSARK